VTAPPAPRVRPSEKEVKAKRAEIARRYRRRKSKTDIIKIIRGRRRNEIEDLVRYRHGTLPDTDDRETYLRFWAWHNLHSTYQREDLHAFARRLGVTLPEVEVEGTLRYVQRGQLRKFSARTLGKHLRLTDGERAWLRITTIEAFDITPAERRRIRRLTKTIKERQRRRAKGVQPRIVYEENSLTRTKPWEAQGISKSTWERRNRVRKQRDASVRDSTLLAVVHRRTLPSTAAPSAVEPEGKGLPMKSAPCVGSFPAYEKLPLAIRMACLCLDDVGRATSATTGPPPP
jgi:hypothetical protein